MAIRILSTLLILFIVETGYSQPFGLGERIPNTSFLISTAGDTLAPMDLEQVYVSVSFTQPIYLTNAADGSDRIFVVEKSGLIKVFPNQVDTQSSKLFLDIQSRVNATNSESGLLSMAFHPQYPDSNKFYVSYNYGNLSSRISEFSVSEDIDLADANSERTILELAQPYSNHNGGQIAFGPDGYLYISFGDGGSGGDPLGNGQNLKTLHGAILRIDIDSYTKDLPYVIPEDNPFVGNSNQWREEIWAWGLRNPWRFSFDRLNGQLWAGDVGQYIWEEVDIIEGGKNYGWNIMEGFHCFSPSSGCDTNGLTLPIVEYNHDAGKSITGGFVYRGSSQPRLIGVYIYADYALGTIWGLQYENGKIVNNKIIAESPMAISSFGEDEAGEIYVVGYSGTIFRFVEKPDTPPISTVPLTIAASGLFKDIETLTLADGLIPFTVNAQLWSDNALKTRILALPDTSKIIFSSDSSWRFPANAVIVKNFFLELERGNSQTKKIIETRFLVRHAIKEQWDGFSYLWNDQQTDATLLDGSYTKSFTIKDGDSTYTQDYYYPSRADCKTCHTAASGFILGPRTAQVNKQHLYINENDSVWDNQLRSYNHIRLFTKDIGYDFSKFPKMTDPFDKSANLEVRVRSYLDANCSNCHQPASSGRTNMDLRYNIPLEAAHLIDAPAELDNLGITDAVRVKPGDPDSSILLLRMLDLAEHRMPPLATSLLDQAGTILISNWIDTIGLAVNIDKGRIVGIPGQFNLYPAYPNPFNASTNIIYQLPTSTQVTLEIYDIRGSKVGTLVSSRQSAGKYLVQWQADSYASGVYFYQLSTDSYTHTRKMILIR